MSNRVIKCRALKLDGQECGKPMTFIRDVFTDRRTKVYAFVCYACGARRAITER